MRPLYTHYAGPRLLETPLLNKSTAFTLKEREAFNLLGLLPPRFETMEEQVARAYQQFRAFDDAMNKHIWLRALQDTNETLFFRLLQLHIEEMLPIIYTPTVGEACEHFSDIYRRARGLFISFGDRHRLDDLLHNVTKRDIKVIVVTDGERVLGLGDQGIGGMGIPIGKLSLYTACGGISPAYTLPVTLDVGTDNPELLADPMYMGSRHERIRGADYDAFVDQVMAAFRRRWPRVLVQFEDFAQPNAMPILNRWQDRACCFNDDIQGTAAVTLGTLLAASAVSGRPLASMRVAILGAGSAGCGIAEQIVRQMVVEGAPEAAARAQVFMVDRQGLLTASQPSLRDFQRPLAQPDDVYARWNIEGQYPSLLEVVREARPSILIGVSGKPGLFTEEVVRAMRDGNARPIIFPLSNPSRQVEATPEQVLAWTGGDAIVATGSPFPPVRHGGHEYPIAQCNNAYIFPGIGLGVVSARARRVDEAMMMAASAALAEASPAVRGTGKALLPPLTELPALSREIAFAVAKAAQARGLATRIPDERLRKRIEDNFWQPQYREYRRVSV
jgi:malate dehydrogenase (oxaloacetate-decarboxylating)